LGLPFTRTTDLFTFSLYPAVTLLLPFFFFTALPLRRLAQWKRSGTQIITEEITLSYRGNRKHPMQVT
jgi:hypothetical protein